VILYCFFFSFKFKLNIYSLLNYFVIAPSAVDPRTRRVPLSQKYYPPIFVRNAVVKNGRKYHRRNPRTDWEHPKWVYFVPRRCRWHGHDSCTMDCSCNVHVDFDWQMSRLTKSLNHCRWEKKRLVTSARRRRSPTALWRLVSKVMYQCSMRCILLFVIIPMTSIT